MAEPTTPPAVPMKSRRQLEEERKQREFGEMMGRYNTNPQGGFSLYGTSDEKATQAANLTQTGALLGQNIFDIGNRANQYDTLIQDRINGKDASSQYLMDQRNRGMANVGRSLAGRGVAGGVASAGMNQAQLEADSMINDKLRSNQAADMALLNSQVRRNQTVVGNALSQGSERGLADQLSTEAGTGISVICTELKRQNLLPQKTWMADHLFGEKLTREEPGAMAAYQELAQPVVRAMKRSKVFTKAVAFWAVPWALNIAGEKNLRGRFVLWAGLGLCRFYAKMIKAPLEA